MKTPLAALLTLVVFFGLSSIAFGQRPTPVGGGSTSTGGTTILNPGNGTSERPKTAKIRGWAWMGTDVDMENPNQSEGGGGWLNFNCDPGFCNGALSNQQGTEEVIPLGGGGGPFSSGGNDGREQNETLPVSGQWGVSADIDRESNTYGHMTGQAWSSNYGWLTLEEDIVSSCWNANPAETSAGPAKILFGENETVARIVGWGKFVNGDDGSLDGYDGCVSFSGSEYGVYIDLQTGDLRGWAWGGPVVGWISFTNDVCPYCNTSIDLDDTVSINFWAEDETVNPGGSTVLRWEATDNGANYVRECPTYSNTSNYSHWRSNSLFGSSTNVGEISTDIGNLPTGSHPISNITQTTNYQLNCIDANGNTLPPRYAIVTVQTGGIGCMDPLASNYDSTATVPGRCLYDNGCTDPLAMNYNPSATVDDGSCLYRERELIQLTANPTTIVVNSGSSGYPVELQWVKSLPAANVNSCTGTFRNNLSTQNINLSGWSGVSLANPNSQTTVTLPSNLGVVNRTYRFDITCIGSQGQTLTDNALVTFIDDSGPGGGCPPDCPTGNTPTLDLKILSPDAGFGSDYEILPAGGANVTLGWEVSNVNLDSCVATSVMSVNGVPEPNNIWNSTNFLTESGTLSLDMTSGSTIGYPTNFRMRCTGANGSFVSDDVTVAIVGISCPPAICPSAPGSGIPGYEEF